MNATPVEVTSETSYDLMVDNLELIVTLLDKPLPRADVLERVGSPQIIERLVRHGLVKADGDRLAAVSGVYHQVRQEGMVSFLEKYVLPGVAATLDDASASSLTNLPLALDAQAARELRMGPVQALLRTLGEISDRPAQGPVATYRVFIIGTSNVVAEPLPQDDAVLEHVRRASIQRATPAERELAVLTEGRFLADESRREAAEAALASFSAALEHLRASPAQASYHLTVASHWQCAQADASAGTS